MGAAVNAISAKICERIVINHKSNASLVEVEVHSFLQMHPII
jgi:hypothetical protein